MSLLTHFCLFDFVELLLAWQFSSQLELRSLVRRFGLLIICLLKSAIKRRQFDACIITVER